MPERKGRKRRPRERRHDRTASEAARTDRSDPAPAGLKARPTAHTSAPQSQALPSSTARATGFMVALVTAFLAAIMISDALTGDRSSIDTAARIVAGVLLVLLSIVVAALCLAPAWVRDMLARRSRGDPP